MAAANPMLLSSGRAADSDLSPIWMVCHLSSVTTARGHVYWFQAPRNEITANEAITGRVTGMATRRRNAKWPKPSSCDASRRSCGMPMNPWRMRKVPNAVARNGRASAG